MLQAGELRLQTLPDPTRDVLDCGDREALYIVQITMIQLTPDRSEDWLNFVQVVCPSEHWMTGPGQSYLNLK